MGKVSIVTGQKRTTGRRAALLVLLLLTIVLSVGLPFCSLVCPSFRMPEPDAIEAMLDMNLPTDIKVNNAYAIKGEMYWLKLTTSEIGANALIKECRNKENEVIRDCAVSDNNRFDIPAEVQTLVLPKWFIRWRTRWWSPYAVKRYESLRIERNDGGYALMLISHDDPIKRVVFLYISRSM